MKQKYMFFVEFSSFFCDSVDVGNLISGSSAFSKSSLYIWKFLVHILLKPSLNDFEHYFASMWNECSCVVVWTFFGTETQGNRICQYFHFFSFYLPWSDGTGCCDLSFLNVEFQAKFSLSSFTVIKRLFSSSLLSPIRVVSSVYLRLLILVLVFCMIYLYQEAGEVVWYSHLLKNFPQFIVIHIVKDS